MTSIEELKEKYGHLNMKPFTLGVRLNREIHDKFEMIAKENNLTKSDLARFLIYECIDKNGGVKQLK